LALKAVKAVNCTRRYKSNDAVFTTQDFVTTEG